MRITLNGNPTNAKLPTKHLPGFTDNFNRASADTLGTTDDAKFWEIVDSSSTPSVWGTTGTGTATMKSATAGFRLAVVDSLSSDGTLTARVSSITGTATKRFGLSVRATDSNNNIQIAPASSTDHRLRVTKRVAGVATALTGNGPELVAGDIVSVVLSGASIIVKVNGVQMISVSVPEFTTATKHGLYAFSGVAAEWDYINFVPA